ncbi:hypothetical protein M9458_013395, partial [Cirrhinus mrigala]
PHWAGRTAGLELQVVPVQEEEEEVVAEERIRHDDAPQPSPSSHSSTPSWCEEPAQSNMDISTGHMIL